MNAKPEQDWKSDLQLWSARSRFHMVMSAVGVGLALVGHFQIEYLGILGHVGMIIGIIFGVLNAMYAGAAGFMAVKIDEKLKR